jgi:hypothetical protein
MECFGKEEAQRGTLLLNSAGNELTVSKQMDLVRPDVFRPELVGALPEVRRECFEGANVASYDILSVIATLEFIQHHFSNWVTGTSL